MSDQAPDEVVLSPAEIVKNTLMLFAVAAVVWLLFWYLDSVPVSDICPYVRDLPSYGECYAAPAQ